MSFADFTPRLGLPYLLSNQAQKHVTLNESLQTLDVLCMASILGTASMPPTEPDEGDAWLLGSVPQGDWSIGQEHDLVAYIDQAWQHFTPQAGWRVWDVVARALYVYDGESWIALAPDDAVPSQLQNLAKLGLGTTATDANPFAIELNAALFNAKPSEVGGSGDLRVACNKVEASGTASFLFQTGWSGRGEVGLTGDDRLTLKVSADGSNWREGWVLDAATSTAETALSVVPQSANTLDLGTSAKPFRTAFFSSDPMISSDARSKSDIAVLRDAESLLSALRPVQFRQDGAKELRFGFLAQDVQAALANTGFSETALWRLSDPDDPESPQMISPTQLIAVLVSAVSGLVKRLDLLETAAEEG